MQMPAKITGPTAWKAAQFSDKRSFSLPIPTDACGELLSLVKRPAIAGKRFDELTREDFEREAAACQALAAYARGIREAIYSGRGFVVVSGIPLDGLSLQDTERLYWLMGLYLGDPVSQSARGDKLGYVEDQTEAGKKASARGYVSRRQLFMHTDSCDIVGLMCVRTAKAGGRSIMASAHAVYNDLLTDAPAALPQLFEGYPYSRRGEQAADAEPITPYKVPVFASVDGRLYCHYVRDIIRVAFRDLGVELTGQDKAAMDAFDAAATSDANVLEFDLAAGDILFMDNFSMLHARSEFEDWDEKERKRLLLRLWLQSRPRWPSPPNMQIFQNKSGRSGIDPQPGGAVATGNFTMYKA
jgi:hypothetical protein